MNDSPTKLNVLFVCDANRLRSPTAETIFNDESSLEVKSAGVGKAATVPCSLELTRMGRSDLRYGEATTQHHHSTFKEIYQRKRVGAWFYASTCGMFRRFLRIKPSTTKANGYGKHNHTAQD